MPGIYEQDHGPFFQSNTCKIQGNQWYNTALAGPETLARFVHSKTTLEAYRDLLECIESDDYTQFLQSYVARGLDTFGDAWRYADICTVLLGIALNLDLRDYLEIGVRRGRSMSMVAHARPKARIIGFDIWQKNYAGLDNPGTEFVRKAVAAKGHSGELELISGDSHITVPNYFKQHPDAYFDCITVDGDHSEEGAFADLLTVIPRLRTGGILVFDDIAHPAHPYLARVWNRAVTRRPEFATYEFKELGYGVAFGIKMHGHN